MLQRINPALALVLVAALALTLAAPTVLSADAANPRVVIDTNAGSIEVEIYADRAPASADNFLAYVRKGFYDDTAFHRVIDGFMIQGGGFTADMIRKPTRDPITNEADNGLKNERGTLAMARNQDPHSATAQFFINLVDNDFLDHTGKNLRGWGYAVFGRVTAGMDVVDTIARAETGIVGGMRDVPLAPMLITRARVVGDDVE